MPEESAPPLAGLRILVVDDDAFITDMLPRKLRRAYPGLDVVTASSPAEGLALMSNGAAPDVVLSDYNLRADLNGLDVLSETARRRPHAVRILMSAHTRHEIGPALDAADIHGLVEKPMRLDEMLSPLLAIIQRARGAPKDHAA